MAKIAWATCGKLAGLSPQESGVVQLLIKWGHEVEPAIWDSKSVNWKSFDVIVIRTIWDYHVKVEQFLEWLDLLESLQVDVFNSTKILKWNHHKFYLEEIAQRGIPIIETEFVKKGASIDFNKIVENLKSPEIIIKPAVSATAHNLLKVDVKKIDHKKAEINKLIKSSDLLIQPFIKEIESGEWSYIFFNKKFSHAVIKKPTGSDFRVQNDFGGTSEILEPPKGTISQAQKVLDVIPDELLYARVDGLVIDGRFYLMELELIEPELFLLDQTLQEKFARAIIEKI
ncbi:MAG: glutathione synthetase [Cyclobacteriaceae bacterium]